MSNHHSYYDEGWNDRLDDEPFDDAATIDWKDGWKDANWALAEGFSLEKV